MLFFLLVQSLNSILGFYIFVLIKCTQIANQLTGKNDFHQAPVRDVASHVYRC